MWTVQFGALIVSCNGSMMGVWGAELKRPPLLNGVTRQSSHVAWSAQGSGREGTSASPPRKEDVVRGLDVTSLTLLDCVSDLMANLAQLTSPNFDEQFNRAPLPLDTAGVLRLIEALHARGLLFIHAGATLIDTAHLGGTDQGRGAGMGSTFPAGLEPAGEGWCLLS
jgi:hypothetical protein